MKLDLNGIGIEDSDFDSVLKSLGNRIQSHGDSCFLVFLEGNLLSLLSEKKVSETISKAEFVCPDGIAVCWEISIRHRKRIERIPGPSFMLRAMEYGQQRGWRHFFYGGSEGVADKLASKMKTLYPNIQIAGTYSPPFRPLTRDEEVSVKEMIESSKTDMLWVGLGGPKQEYWMAEHLNKINVPVMLGVGAAFDFHTGARPWAPKLVRKLGIEWMFRMFTGGRRTFFRNLKCISKGASMLACDFFLYRVLGKKTN